MGIRTHKEWRCNGRFGRLFRRYNLRARTFWICRWPWDQSQSSTIIETGSSLNKGGRDFRKLIVILHFMVLRGLFDFGHREVQLVPAFDCIWKDFQRAS